MFKHSFKLVSAVALLLIAGESCNDNSSKKAADGSVVTADNFCRAETDHYFSLFVSKDGLGKIGHNREFVPVDKQTVIRYNRDVLTSAGVFDLDAGPVTITLPNAGKRFFSILAINEDHYMPIAGFNAGDYTLTRENMGTRYAAILLRIFADPNDPKDMDEAHALQDKVTVKQPGGPGKFEVPGWDTASLNRTRDSLLVLGRDIVDFKGAFGTKEQVDSRLHLLGTAVGWGGNPESVAVYQNFTPAKNDGKTIYKLHIPADVPVDAFWSISLYNAKGYFEKNPYNTYNLNNVTAKKNKDGSVDVQFGGCDGKAPNCLPIMEGWNYIVRLYRPHSDIINNTWKFPEAQPMK